MSEADRDKWNARFGSATPRFEPHPILADLRELTPGRALELACGPSGSALALAAAGWRVTALDVSDVAIAQLAAEALRRGLEIGARIADLDGATLPAADLVLATRYWDRAVFARAAAAVAPGGLLAWETFSSAERRYRPGFTFTLADDEPASLLPADFTIVVAREIDDGASATRRLIARRA